MTYSQTLEYLYSQLPMFQRIGAAAYKADLGNTMALTEILGHPERKFKSIHIAGTNGKGSVAHLLASVLQEAGYKTGLYTSPHLKDFRERIRINGKMVPKHYVQGFVSKNRKSFEAIKPSFFEYTAVMAFEYFAEQHVDIAIMETGMGGRLDSTNVITPVVSVITNISMDHAAFLGDSLEKIAGEKAGIIKKNVPVVIGETQAETKDIFNTVAYEKNAPIFFADQSYKTIKRSGGRSAPDEWMIQKDGENFLEALKCPLRGNYQAYNLSTTMMVIEVLKEIGYTIDPGPVRSGIRKVVQNTELKGRWQQLGENPKIICDVGHNEAGIRLILEQLKQENYRHLQWVFGMVNDKDSEHILSLLPTQAHYYFCRPNIPRGLDAQELTSRAKAFHLIGESYSSVKEAFEAATQAADPEDLIFIGGSTFVVAEVL